MASTEFISYLTRKGVLRDGAVDDGAKKAIGRGASNEIDWLGVTKLTSSAFAEELADFYNCARVQRTELLGGQFAGQQLSRRFLSEHRLFPYKKDSGVLSLAVAAPTDEARVRAVEVVLRQALAIEVATAEDIDAAFATTLDATPNNAVTSTEAAPSDDNLDDLRDLARGAPVVRAIDELLRMAVEQRATDVHIEPTGNTLQVRLRVDGLLRNVPAPPMSMAKGLLSRLKIMAGLNITERRLPQDGRARIAVGGAEVDLRVATMPTMSGESAVVRLLRKGGGIVALDKLGLTERDESILRDTLRAPYGMIIVTGPTGSGKTTTLAASLAEINEPTRKILTIEDPVEYQIPGINQTQIHAGIGLTFATALRSFLRHDPDVIMVGEMRDAETAHIGVHASLTGHLVLTTLHTNTAAGAIARMIDMEVESFLLASCVRAIVGQRLVRVLCDNCKQRRVLSDADLVQDRRYAAVGFAANDTIFEPKGCEWCNFSGFHGRKGVFEVIEVTPTVRDAIGPKTTATELERIARREGMISMTEDGIAKCRSGLTTVDEIFRVVASL